MRKKPKKDINLFSATFFSLAEQMAIKLIALQIMCGNSGWGAIRLLAMGDAI
jgi:hypothetical protein